MILRCGRFLGARIRCSAHSTLLQLKLFLIDGIIVAFNDGLLYLSDGLWLIGWNDGDWRFAAGKILSAEIRKGGSGFLVDVDLTQITFGSYFLLSVIVVVYSGSCVDVMLPTDVISVTSVADGASFLTMGTESLDRFKRGSVSQLFPSSQFRASGPSFRIRACRRTKGV